ncbi:MAG: glycosyltransferase family 4 protein [Bacteroidia bacterium]
MESDKRSGRIPLIFCTDGIFPHSVGGMQRHSRLLVEALAATGEVDITVLHPHPGIQVFPGLSNVTEVALPPLPGKKHYFLELRDYSKLVLAEIEKRPDHLVYSQGLSVWVGLNRVRKRLIVNPHGLEPYQTLTFKERLKTWPYRWVFNRIFRNAARVVSLGGSLTRILQRAGRNVKVVVLPNATQVLPVPDSDLLKSKAKPLKFLFVGRFAHNKGIDVLLAAAERLNIRGFSGAYELHLAGKGPLYDAMRSKYRLPNVHFWGFVSDEDLDTAYLQDHVFVLPTLFEGMPTVVLEAMARAMPILVTDTGATLELVGPENGNIIPKQDVEGLAVAMRVMIDMDAAQFQAMSASSLSKVKERFSWESVAQGHLALFRELWQSL